ncbi:lysine transporter LysE [Oceanicola sp. 22II-s10i]|uniref:LysE family translocator n=1 Tax=Oceanicola sp. 22II-s10i TaxID=1317116 RepID=UPI000B528B7C|nr:LysE family translocator [Oceanicola sp. 22II-s10i]OWU84253.1 lysine transporter LysE [Oceanicola sp. 22II-s10i]
MPLDTWLIYVATVLLLMITPGPSHLLMLSNSLSNGLKRSSMTAAGDLTANLFQMLAAGFGLAALVLAVEHALTAIKLAGVAYLLWLGARKLWLARPGREQAARPRASLRSLWMQGFITSAANPKAVVFFAALFPQFIAADLPFWPQFLILSATYIALDGAFLLAYGGAAHWLADRMAAPARLWIDRIGGAAMIVAAILLGLKTVDDVARAPR